MSIGKIGLFIIVGGLAISMAGCVTNSKYGKETNLMRSQLELIQSDLDSLRSSQQRVEDSIDSSQVQAPASSSSLTYSTPSGFTLPSADIQTALKNAGYYTGPLDGKVGRLTKTSIKRFQEDNGLVPDGVCGRNTWAKLGNFLEGASRIK